MDNLQPCPFCGGKGGYAHTGVYWVACQSCFAQADHGGTREEAAAIWNRRAPSSSVAVSGEVSFDAWWDVFFRLAGKDKAWPVKQAAREAFALLALAGSGGKK